MDSNVNCYMKKYLLLIEIYSIDNPSQDIGINDHLDNSLINLYIYLHIS